MAAIPVAHPRQTLYKTHCFRERWFKHGKSKHGEVRASDAYGSADSGDCVQSAHPSEAVHAEGLAVAVTAPKYMREKWLLSIDPGGKGGDTGIVLLRYRDDEAPTLVNSWAIGGGLDGFRDWYLNAWYGLGIAETVIVENFVHFKAIQIETTPILIEGAVRFIWPNAVLSPASGKDTQMPDTMMEKLGFSKAGFSGDHHSDRWSALKHALRWLKHNRHIPTLKLISA